jgi:hypothetical protein
MICQTCGVEAPTKYVAFSQNIGAVFMRFHKSIKGRLCKNCVHQHFWSMTGTTLVLGWWGTISFIVTPFFLLNNIGRYALCLGMPPVPAGATVPQLTDDAVERIGPFAQSLFDRLNRGDDFDKVVLAAAGAAGVAPAQVILYVRAVIEAHQGQQ